MGRFWVERESPPLLHVGGWASIVLLCYMCCLVTLLRLNGYDVKAESLLDWSFVCGEVPVAYMYMMLLWGERLEGLR